MSLDSFFNSLDTEAQLTAWKASTIQKLNHLNNIIPTENSDKITYIQETIDIIHTLTLLPEYSVVGKVFIKPNLVKRLHNCNLYYKEFGTQ